MQAIILSSLRIKNLFQALDCMPEIERPKRMPFLDGTSFNSVPFEINYDCLFAALKKKKLHTQSFLKANPTWVFFHSSRECMLCVCPLLVFHCVLKDVVAVLGLGDK